MSYGILINTEISKFDISFKLDEKESATACNTT